MKNPKTIVVRFERAPGPGQVRNIRRERSQELPSSSRSANLIVKRIPNHSKRLGQCTECFWIRVRDLSWE